MGKLKVVFSSLNNDNLKQAGSADPLFNGVVWQNAWWAQWGARFDLCIIIIKDGKDIICKLPLYVDLFKFKKLFFIRRLQFIGTNYQNILTPRTEYLAFSALQGYKKESVSLGLGALKTVKWDEFVARDIIKGDLTDLAITKWAKNNNWLVRVLHNDIAYSVNTASSFEEYVKSLGPNSRLRVFNRRRMLEAQGNVVIENYYPNRVVEFFKLMNEFHEKRWGDSFSEQTLGFHQEVIRNSQQGDIEVELSVLSVAGECESVMFNYIMGDRVYNINSGFNINFSKKMAIGMLHFGYLIEAAFINQKINTFDFLAGQGKNSNYKENIATDSTELYTIQVVRNGRLRVLYKINDFVKDIKKVILFFALKLKR